jgi:hypothetical protein
MIGARAFLAVLLAASACGGNAPDPRFPARPEGCDVKIIAEAPTMPIANLGTVNAVCDESVSDEDCRRTLRDEVCKLGGDLVWGVGDAPTKVVGKNRWSGRAAHTK